MTATADPLAWEQVNASTWKLDVGPLRLCATATKWWCMGHMKAQPALSLEGAQHQALLWAREQWAAMRPVFVEMERRASRPCVQRTPAPEFP